MTTITKKLSAKQLKSSQNQIRNQWSTEESESRRRLALQRQAKLAAMIFAPQKSTRQYAA